MSQIKKIAEAKTTCDGLHRLIRKLNVAAVDLDKSGGSAYELAGLLASAHACVSSLSTQLDGLANDARADQPVYAESPANAGSIDTQPVTDTVTPLLRATKNRTSDEKADIADLATKSFSVRG